MNKPGQSRDQKKRFLLSLACRYGHLGDGRAEVLEMEKVSQAALPREGYPQRLREGKPWKKIKAGLKAWVAASSQDISSTAGNCLGWIFKTRKYNNSRLESDDFNGNTAGGEPLSKKETHTHRKIHPHLHPLPRLPRIRVTYARVRTRREHDELVDVEFQAFLHWRTRTLKRHAVKSGSQSLWGIFLPRIRMSRALLTQNRWQDCRSRLNRRFFLLQNFERLLGVREYYVIACDVIIYFR